MDPNRPYISVSMEKLPVFGGDRPEKSSIALWWLGQAGFAIETGGCRILIDPYLSDSLAVKYAGTEFPHIRMMPPPIQPGELENVDYILCSHSHTDHMDPGTLPEVLNANPQCRIAIPRSMLNYALEIGLPERSLRPVNSGETIQPCPEIQAKAIPAAHETLRVDESGNHHYLGYIIKTPWMNLYHSGDCVPYPGLGGVIKAEHIDVALLPVNGRDEYRLNKGILGNFHSQEAVELCRVAGIKVLFPHHFGMFDFNTVPIESLKLEVAMIANETQMIIPEPGWMYTIRKSSSPHERRDS